MQQVCYAETRGGWIPLPFRSLRVNGLPQTTKDMVNLMFARYSVITGRTC